jgi:formate hydrogenlyase transcriptional activator
MPKKLISSSEIEEIVRREREKSALLGVSQQISKSRNFVDLMEVMTAEVKPLLGFDDFVVAVLSKDKTKYKVINVNSVSAHAERGFHPVVTDNLNKEISLAEDVWVTQDKITERTAPYYFTVSDRLKKYPGYYWLEMMHETGLRSTISQTLRHQNEIIGFLGVHFAHELENPENLFPLIEGIAGQLAAAVANLLANEEILEREREKTLLLSLSEDIAAIRNAADLLRVVYDKIRTIFPFDDAGLFVLDRTGERHRDLFVDFGLVDTDLYKNAMPTGWIQHRDSVLEKLMEQPGTRLIDFEELTQEYPGYPQYAPMLEAGIKQLVGAPLKQGEKILGMLFFNSTRAGFYSEKDFSLFESIANQIAVAVSNILANEEILEREREKTVQIEIIHALTAPQSSEDLITKIAAEMNKIIRLDAFSLHLQRDGEFLDFEYNDLRAVRENDRFVPLRRYAFWKEKGVSSEKLRDLIGRSTPLLTKKAFYVGENYLALARENELIQMISEVFGFRSVMYAPVRLQNGALMTLAAASRDENAFSAEILEKFCETGAQIALAVESNLAFAEISELKKRLEEENTYLAEEVRTAYDFGEIVGSAPALQEVFRRLELVAPTDTTVLLEGETGTGKELFARAIHDLSPRKSRPLIKINCAALPATLIESELFGHERGAFTGASERRVGKFELANNGTIFLDEIGELPLELQAKLLRVLQEREVERIGGKTPLKINIRIVAATNRDLRAEVAAGKFRQDLFFRLNTVVLTLPALRSRREDIPALALHFAQKYAARIGRRIRGISNKMLAELMRYDFPGNVRELEHIIEEAVIFSKGENLQLHRPLAFTLDQTAPIHTSETDSRPPQTLAEIERAHILAVLEKTGGRIRGEQGAAEILNIKPTTLEARMKKLGIRKQHV